MCSLLEEAETHIVARELNEQKSTRCDGIIEYDPGYAG